MSKRTLKKTTTSWITVHRFNGLYFRFIYGEIGLFIFERRQTQFINCTQSAPHRNLVKMLHTTEKDCFLRYTTRIPTFWFIQWQSWTLLEHVNIIHFCIKRKSKTKSVNCQLNMQNAYFTILFTFVWDWVFCSAILNFGARLKFNLKIGRRTTMRNKTALTENNIQARMTYDCIALACSALIAQTVYFCVDFGYFSKKKPSQ